MTTLKGYVTYKEEWVYPDVDLKELPEHLHFAMPSNGRRGIQFVLGTSESDIQVEIEGAVDHELFELVHIPVEYNTISDEEQGGQFVQLDYSLQKPEQSTRKAPFDVYDCLKPVEGNVPSKNQRAAFYITMQPQEGKTGTIPVTITLRADSKVHQIAVELKVYNVAIPEEKLQITNWFNLENMAKYHQCAYGSHEHLEMIRKYAKAMRRLRQTHFFISIDERSIVDKAKWTFNFDYLKPFIEIFFEEGLQTMELGYIATRSPNYTGKDFNFVLDNTLSLETMEGYLVMNRYLKAIRDFLKENKWEDKVVFHISDEPDVHTTDEAILEERKRIYYMMTSQLRKYIPGVKIIEAVGTPKFKGGIDIWVPLSASYEKQKEAFDQLIENGEEVWNYVCCSPAGKYLNRFLDFALIKNRLLFWSCSAYRLTGFLHWGLNMYLYDMNPFEATSCHNDTGLGTNFPCGDAFLVYPGTDGPWLSMRLEAQRRGAEDCELLNLLREKDYQAYERIVSAVFQDNQHYLEDVDGFEAYYEELLDALSK
ncbi:MAG: DUF4091 domain-containing protein [Cellulosilyticaceae bacterium]